jgi:2-dehydropantoate 2-reductase
MKTCVVGAGAIGGLIGADLALAGGDVTLIDVDAQLEAIRREGLRVRSADQEERVARDVRATDSFREAGEQDLVILAVKAQVIRDVVQDMRALYRPDTVVLTVQNGLPWWYFQRHGGAFDGWSLTSLDPDGRIATHLEPERILGCVAYPAATLERPGVIRHLYGRSFPVGELDGSDTDRLRATTGLFEGAGYKSWVLDDVRAELWLKLIGVLAFNPISALTHATMEEVCENPEIRTLIMELMTEAQSVAEALGITLRVPLERRLRGAQRVGQHRTSMLQDVEAGRSLEVEALLGSVIEVGRKVEVPTPRIEALYAYTKLLDQTLVRRGAGIRSLYEGPRD